MSMRNPWKQHNYVSLSTKKRDGSWVDTPVWYALKDDALYCFSEGKAGKVKRLKNFRAVRINPCTVRGKLLGEWEDAEGYLLTKAQESQAHQALIDKYGWQMRLLDCLSTMAGKINKRAYIKISLVST